MSEPGGVDKSLLAFLNGLAKRIFFNEADITDQFLRSDVLGGMPEEGALLLEKTVFFFCCAL